MWPEQIARNQGQGKADVRVEQKGFRWLRYQKWVLSANGVTNTFRGIRFFNIKFLISWA